MSNLYKVISVTGLSIIASILAVRFMAAGNFSAGFLWIISAIIFDSLDGYLARRLKVESSLGAWLDSAADVFIFLIFPLTYWFNYLHISVIVALIVFLAGCFRLVRHAAAGYGKVNGKLFFTGLPSSSTHFILLLSVYFTMSLNVLSALLIIDSLLMVSTFPIPKPSIKITIFLSIIYLLAISYKVVVGF